MTEIKKIYDKIYSGHLTQDPKQLISYYEQNKGLIEVEDLLPSNPDYDGIMRITSDYAKSLSYYGNSKKALIYLNKAIELFKNSNSENLAEIPYFETLIWIRGTEYYNQKEYAFAKTDFQYLVDNYPENDKYRNWLLGVKTIRLKKYSNITLPIFLICFIWLTFLNDKQTTLKYILLIIGAISFIISISMEIINFFLKKRIQRK